MSARPASVREYEQKVRYVVRWCSSIPEMRDCPGEGDFDRAVYEEEAARDFKHAVRLAKLVLARGDDAFGAPRVEEQAHREIAPGERVWRWEVSGSLEISSWNQRCAFSDIERSGCEEAV